MIEFSFVSLFFHIYLDFLISAADGGMELNQSLLGRCDIHMLAADPSRNSTFELAGKVG